VPGDHDVRRPRVEREAVERCVRLEQAAVPLRLQPSDDVGDRLDGVVQVVPLLARVDTTMSPGRNGKPDQPARETYRSREVTDHRRLRLVVRPPTRQKEAHRGR